MQEISRRTVLVGAAAAAVAVSVPASAGSVKALQEDPSSSCKTLADAQICATVYPAQDVAGIRYTITNGGDLTLHYLVWYVDQDSGRESRRRTVVVEPGMVEMGDLYGSLKHCFVFHACDLDRDGCVEIGPLCAET